MYTARVRYTGIAGIEFAAYHNHGQDMDNTAGSGEISANMWGAHVVSSPSEGLGYKALYGWWDLDCDATHVCSTNGYAHQWGGLVETSYRWNLGGAMDSSVGVAYRFEMNDEKADSKVAGSAKLRQHNVLMNYWLSPNAVLKVDYENTKIYSSGKGTNGYNFGIGYQF